MIVSVTGHRPKSLVGREQYVSHQLRNAIIDTGATLLMQGMADGVDLMAAMTAHELNVPYVAVRPWAGHYPSPPWRARYDWALQHADDVLALNEEFDYPGPRVYHERNHYLVDNSDAVISVWNGAQVGGTWQTTRYALEIGRPVLHIDTKGLTVKWLDSTKAKPISIAGS